MGYQIYYAVLLFYVAVFVLSESQLTDTFSSLQPTLQVR